MSWITALGSGSIGARAIVIVRLGISLAFDAHIVRRDLIVKTLAPEKCSKAVLMKTHRSVGSICVEKQVMATPGHMYIIYVHYVPR